MQVPAKPFRRAGSKSVARKAPHWALTFGVTVLDLEGFIADSRHRAQLNGRMIGTLFPGEPEILDGTWNLFTEGPGRIKFMEYAFNFVHEGKSFRFHGKKRVEEDPLATDAIQDLTTLFSQITNADGHVVAAGIIRFDILKIFNLLNSIGVSGTDEPLKAKALFIRHFLNEETRILISGWKDFEIKDKRRLLSLSNSQIQVRYDVVIIGSGYGGGVTAARLAAWRDGTTSKSVCVLERGKEWRSGDFPDEPWEVLKEVRSDSNPDGLFDAHRSPDLDVVVGNGLGGTSLINANVMIEPDLQVFSVPPWPRDLPDLGPYLKRAKATLHTQEIENLPLKARVFSAAAEDTAGLTGVQRPPLAVTFDSQLRPEEEIVQRACVYCGSCVTGCNYTSKNTVDMNYLALAQRAGASIFTSVEVQTVEPLTNGMIRVHYRDLENRKHGTVDAGQVIVSAGTLGSFKILRKSQLEHGLHVSEMLGEAFSGNGDVLGLGYNLDKRTNINNGPTITTAAKYWSSEELKDHFVIEEGAIPKALMALVRQFLPALRFFGKDTDRGIWDSVEESVRILADLATLETHGALNHSLLYLGMGFEQRLGRLFLDEDNVRVEWPDVAKQAFAENIDEKMEEITSKVGGTYVKNPSSRTLFGGKLVTVHPLGGCIMGDDESKGVVNARGEVFGHEGSLYVADGSVIPAPLGVNPALTITALAEVCAEHIIERWSTDD